MFTKLSPQNISRYTQRDILVVEGVVDHLAGSLVSSLKEEIGFNFVYSKKINSDIIKYFKSYELVSLEKNSHTYSALIYTLNEFGFEKVDKIQNRGEWEVKGDIVKFWPIEYSNPVRISYFDEEIESVQTFDEIYGTKINDLESAMLGKLTMLADKVDWLDISLSGEENLSLNLKLCLKKDKFGVDVSKFGLSARQILELDYTFPNLFFKRFDILEKELERLQFNDYNIQIFSRHPEGIPESLSNYLISDKENSTKWLTELPAGFVSATDKQIFLTDRELYGTIFLSSQRKQLSSKKAMKLLERLEGEIEVDDFVVHEDHGIGVYKGIHQEITYETKIIDFENVKFEVRKDFLKVDYAEGDEVLLPISQIQKITKYIGTEGEEPEVTRLHKGSWKKLYTKTKKQVELIAKDLVEHYAKLQLAETIPFEYEDTETYKKFVEAFPYEATPDQLTAEEDIRKDLAQDKPMNRLIVGDVGFGKTEVAMRAAFRAVEQGNQVAVLCPTTVLAAQHFKVFRDRFEEFGIKVNYVSRFNSTAENKEIVAQANAGDIDILVGTHRILSADVKFNNLGLVIVDEEQKFGVKQKEKIRQIQYDAHSLAMSATPIPRTLSMALSQIQDISIIATPPTVRRAVETHVERIDWQKIVNNILNELKRGGQVYFVHNKVETIESIRVRLQGLLPDVRFAVGHGQMSPKNLDKTITDFYEERYDVLIASTIIENGIDMPNVNTMIINDAQNLGLGQLYQLRGRVGRAKRQGFCYLYYRGDNLDANDKFADDRATAKDVEVEDKGAVVKVKGKKKKYIDRLKAILESQELGSGFKLASRDLEIRGAGNLLGKQQHGNIKNVGLALYMQMLAEEIDKMRSINEALEKAS